MEHCCSDVEQQIEKPCQICCLSFPHRFYRCQEIRVILKEMGKDKGKSQGSGLSRVEIFRWLLINGMNKADIDELKQRS